MIQRPQRLLLLGCTGQLGSELRRRMPPGIQVVGLSRGQRPGSAPDQRADVLAGDALSSQLRPGDLVVDASAPFQSHGGRTLAGARRALAQGAHWIDLSAERAGVVGSAELDAEAKQRGVCVLSGAGLFPGLTAAYVRLASEGIKRVNEVLIGWAPGAGLAFGPASHADLLLQAGRDIKQLLGGEWSTRRAFGDRRAFFHPDPLGAIFSYNLDVPDLDLFTGPGFKAASVRVSVGAKPWRLRWALRSLAAARPGMDAGKLARKVRWIAGQPAVHGGGLTILVRGLDLAGNPQERRQALLFNDSGVGLAATPALLLIQKAFEARLEPGAGPCTGQLTAAELGPALAAIGIKERSGSLGGWRP
jgi:hypothetical protein